MVALVHNMDIFLDVENHDNICLRTLGENYISLLESFSLQTVVETDAKFSILDSLYGIKDMAKFTDNVKVVIAPEPVDMYTRSNGEKVAIKDMIDEHLVAAAMKIVKENQTNLGGPEDEDIEKKLSRLAITNTQFRLLYKEIKRRDL